MGHWRKLLNRIWEGKERTQVAVSRDETYLIFRAKKLPGPLGELPSAYTLRSWRPTPTSVIPPTFGLRMVAFWVFHYCGVFRSNDYEVLLIETAGNIVHSTWIVPKFFRWPFMAPGDIQLSSMWTDEAHRGLGLATFASRYAVARKSPADGGVWFAARVSNSAAIAVSTNSGFELAGVGRRMGRFGARLLGSLVLVPQNSVIEVTGSVEKRSIRTGPA